MREHSFVLFCFAFYTIYSTAFFSIAWRTGTSLCYSSDSEEILSDMGEIDQ